MTKTRMFWRAWLPRLLVLALVAGLRLHAAELEEFNVKRQENFEFDGKPTVSRSSIEFRISFKAKSFCDATVVVENQDGKIVRHLASGVLGKNAPKPFVKDSLKQELVWDGKNDQGNYVENLDTANVRVSLGLKPEFERSLYWTPYKRFSDIAPIPVAAPEGVYVFEGRGVDSLKLFNHDGQYVRTIYPFPANKVESVNGLQHFTFPQCGQSLPLKLGFTLATLLSSGSSGRPDDVEGHWGGYGATAAAVQGTSIALVSEHLNRLDTSGASGGLPIKGPRVCFEHVAFGNKVRIVGPTSAAFSPDGKWLYLTGFIWKTDYWAQSGDCLHVVTRMAYAEDKPPEVFAGLAKADDGYGTGNDRLCVPSSVACDAQGRVYISEFANSRIQIFAPDGKYLKTMATPNPARVTVDPRTGEIFSFSWPMFGCSNKVYTEKKLDLGTVKPSLCKLGTFDQPKTANPLPLPFGTGDGFGGWGESGGQVYQAAIDFWTTPQTLWSAGRKASLGAAELNWSGGNAEGTLKGWERRGVRILTEKDGKWELKTDFAAETKKAVGRVAPADFSRQRLYVNPKEDMLFVGEDDAFCKSFDEMLAIDPNTGKISTRDLPFDTEDLCFDLNGNIYLRTDSEVLRFDPQTWREVPWDYGEDRDKVFFQTFSAPRRAAVSQSALPIPGSRSVDWHLGGLYVTPKGEIAVTCLIRSANPKDRSPRDRSEMKTVGKPYAPKLFPGRAGAWIVAIWDKHGKMIVDDAVPGLPGTDGIGLDPDLNVTAMVRSQRMLGSKPYFNGFSETLMKFKARENRVVSASPLAPIPLTAESTPTRTADISGPSWIEGLEWIYGGVGHGGQTGGCVCWYSRFAYDYLGRSCVPETDHYSVAIVDSAGNLILRVGKYGNVEDGKPLIADGGPANPRSIGGDEVALFHPSYVGMDTDRRLYIYDAGNFRIVSVKLNYHATERVALQGVGK